MLGHLDIIYGVLGLDLGGSRRVCRIFDGGIFSSPLLSTFLFGLPLVWCVHS